MRFESQCREGQSAEFKSLKTDNDPFLRSYSTACRLNRAIYLIPNQFVCAMETILGTRWPHSIVDRLKLLPVPVLTLLPAGSHCRIDYHPDAGWKAAARKTNEYPTFPGIRRH